MTDLFHCSTNEGSLQSRDESTGGTCVWGQSHSTVSLRRIFVTKVFIKLPLTNHRADFLHFVNAVISKRLTIVITDFLIRWSNLGHVDNYVVCSTYSAIAVTRTQWQKETGDFRFGVDEKEDKVDAEHPLRCTRHWTPVVWFDQLDDDSDDSAQSAVSTFVSSFIVRREESNQR